MQLLNDKLTIFLHFKIIFLRRNKFSDPISKMILICQCIFSQYYPDLVDIVFTEEGELNYMSDEYIL